MTLAAVSVVSPAADQVAQEAQSKTQLADGLRVSEPGGYWKNLSLADYVSAECTESAESGDVEHGGQVYGRKES